MMLAKIKTAEGFYDSIVFAIYDEDYSPEVLVFNQDYTVLQFVKMWTPNRNVIIYNADKEGWSTKEKFEGYDWVLREFPVTKISETILERCKELQASIKECEWFEIKNNADIDGLLYASLAFHDSFIKEIYVKLEKQYIHFDTMWGVEILFKLEENIETNLFKNCGAFITDNDEFYQIFDATMFFENGLIYWTDDESLVSFDEIQKYETYYFCAKNIKWKLIINTSF